MKTLHRYGVGLLLGLVSVCLFGATYQMFSPGGALSGTWNSQSVALDSGSFITGTLPVARGGTNLVAAADDNAVIGNGTTWESKAIPNCGSSTQALAYATSTNAFSCQTISGTGAALTTGTWTTTLTTGCTTQPTQDWAYSAVGSGSGALVTIAPVAVLTTCTSNATTFSSASGSVPAAIRPSRTIFFPLVNMTDNSTQGSACLVLDANGTLRYVVEEVLTTRCGVAAWTTSGSKQVNFSSGAFGGSTFSYRID